MESISKNLARHFREVVFGGNWTDVNLYDTLHPVTFDKAMHESIGQKTVASLSYHIYYYINGVLPVFEGGRLAIHDKFSFSHPSYTPSAWDAFKNDLWNTSRTLENHISDLDDSMLFQPFAQKKYGSYFRNITGITEHTHYHLGQIIFLIKY